MVRQHTGFVTEANGAIRVLVNRRPSGSPPRTIITTVDHGFTWQLVVPRHRCHEVERGIAAVTAQARAPTGFV